MSVTFVKKYHVCSMCKARDYELFAIARNSDINTEYPIDSKPADLKENGVYTEYLVRDEFGIILSRIAQEKLCLSCNSTTLEAEKKDNETPVSNFYPQTEAHKWLDGLAKAGV